MRKRSGLVFQKRRWIAPANTKPCSDQKMYVIASKKRILSYLDLEAGRYYRAIWQNEE